MANTAVKTRAYAAIVGGLVADAASMGLHWIYDVEKLHTLIGSKSPAFFEPPSCPFYNYKSGELSPYGAESMALLESVAAQGRFDLEAFEKDYYEFAKSYSGRLNHISKEFITAYEAGKKYPEIGADDSQANCLVKVPIIVARYAGSDDLLSIVEKAVRVHQNNDLAVKYAIASATLLNKIILGASVKAALDSAESGSLPSGVEEDLRNAIAFAGEHTGADGVTEAAKKFGLSCALPGSFLCPIVSLARNLSYEESVNQNIAAGGDQCSRAVFVGACIAAASGIESVPTEWQNKTSKIQSIKELASKLVDSA